LGYRLVIANHVVRKCRPEIFFNNAQAAYKRDAKVEETNFFAYPKTYKVGHKEFDLKEGSFITHTFDETMAGIPMVVDAFAGAFHSVEEWQRKISQKTDAKRAYDTYISHLLTDHVPIDFVYTDPVTKTKTRVLFANTASLIGDRGILDNIAAFKGLKLNHMEELSKQLLIPLTDEMIKLIEENKKVLQWSGKWSIFEGIITSYNSKRKALKKQVKPNCDQREQAISDLYGFLTDLSDAKWFGIGKEGDKDYVDPERHALNALSERDFQSISAIQFQSSLPLKTEVTLVNPRLRTEGQTKYVVCKPDPKCPLHENQVRIQPPAIFHWKSQYEPGYIKKFAFNAEVVSLTKGSYQVKDTRLPLPLGIRVTLVGSNPKKDGHTKYTVCGPDDTDPLGENQVRIRPYDGEYKRKHLRMRKRDEFNAEVVSFNFIFKKGKRILQNCKVKFPGTKPLRRMAQREFSSRRDSPVMVRLLEEIIAAQDD